MFKIFSWAKDNKDTKSVIDDISNNTKVEETKDDENTELINEPENKDETNDYWYYIKQPLINVDINALKEKNKDTVGWINVNNTNINYPYVQGKDNKYYLNHSYDKSYNEAGWVFLDYRNNSTLSDKNNILYAHSRLDKTMFGSLSKTLKSNWYNNKDNHIIRLSTETENTMWQIFSVYKIPEETYYITTNFSNDSEYEKFF
ncbi:MAG: class B sortase [Bacilli bacterium]|nr:MAG: class B sortase [Bacilli bacterium]